MYVLLVKNEGPFPGEEPERGYDLRSSTQDVQSSIGHSRPSVTQNVQANIQQSGDRIKAPAPAAYRGPPTSSVMGAAGASHSVAPPMQPIYERLEKTMEEKAKKMGGLALRREFFQFLQKARDQVRLEHPGCASDVKHWLADGMTWAKFCK
jgi:hypothetical protein